MKFLETKGQENEKKNSFIHYNTLNFKFLANWQSRWQKMVKIVFKTKLNANLSFILSSPYIL